MMAMASEITEKYRHKYEKDIEGHVQKNYTENKETILESKGVYFLKEKAFIDKNDLLNMDTIRPFLSTPIWELEEEHEWVADYIAKVRFCNEFAQFEEYHKWKGEHIVSGRNNRLKEIRRDFLQIKGFDRIIVAHGLDCTRMIKSRKEFDTAVEKVRNELEEINSAVKQLLSYGIMTDTIKNEIKITYGVEVCPYCNRQFISWWEEKGGKRSTSDLDHFLPKSLFPLFALNIYNLIPVCLVCNRYIKLDRYLSIWNPFQEGFDNKTNFFVHKQENAEAYIGLNTDFEIKLQPNKNLESTQKKLLNGTIWFFKYNELYNNHKEYVKDLLRKKYIYTPEVVEEINRLLGARSVSHKEVELLLYEVTKDDDSCNNKILGKLTYDILWGDA